MGKRFSYSLIGAAVALSILSCTKSPIPEASSPTKMLVSFDVKTSAQTKMAPSPTSAQEEAINKLAILIYNGTNLETYFESTEETSTVFALEPGTYNVAAIANYPVSFSPSSATSLSTLRETASYLDDNSVGNLVMYGESSVTVTRSANERKYISIRRMVAKLGVKKITVNFTSPVVAEREFVLRKIYVTNAFRRSKFAGTVVPAATTSLWYNRMGYASSPKNDLLADASINAAVAQGSSYSTEHYFYCYENTITASGDSNSFAWSPRCTRLVIEATVGSETYYWPITIPNIARNRTYFASEVIIKKLGSVSPDVFVPESADVEFYESVNDWDDTYDFVETF